MDRRLKIPQAALLLHLRQSEGGRSYIGPNSSQHKPALALVALGLAVESSGHYQLTESGIQKADELNTVFDVALPPAERPPVSEEEFQAQLEQDVKDAEERLARVKARALESEERCLHTPDGYGNRQQLRDDSMRDLGKVEDAEADLEKAKRDLRLLGKPSRASAP